jgi:hypothetical protein
MSKIVKGSDVSIPVTLFLEDSAGVRLPQDLTSKTISVKYKNSSGVVVMVTGSPGISVLNAVYGNLSLNLTDTETDALKSGDFPFNVILVEGSTTQIFIIEKQITVVDRI